MNTRLLVVFALVGVFALACGLGPDSVSEIHLEPEPTPDIEATVQAAVAEALGTPVPEPEPTSAVQIPVAESKPATLAPTKEPKSVELNNDERTKADENRRRCDFWLLNNPSTKSIMYHEFTKLDPDNMDDLDRILWETKLNEAKPRGVCRDYWSEPLAERNKDKRNHQWEAVCRTKINKHIGGSYRGIGDQIKSDSERAYQTANAYILILKWLDIPGDELLDQLGSSDGIVDYHDEHVRTRENPGVMPDDQDIDYISPDITEAIKYAESCVRYYPQAFTGRWIPNGEDVPGPGESYRQELIDEEPVRYDPDRTPLYLPKTVNHQRVEDGRPLGEIEDKYVVCSSSSGITDLELAGYYWVKHPKGNYCEKE